MVTASAPWPGRAFFGALLLRGRVWLFGGCTPYSGGYYCGGDTFLNDVWGALGGAKDDMYIYTPGGVLHAHLPGGPSTDLSTPEGYANVKQVLQEAASVE